MLLAFFGRIGLKGIALSVNSIGDKECRPKYVEKLREALREAKDQLGPDSQRRIETNPLRVLDSKSPDEQPIIEKLPRIAEHLCDACHDHYAELKRQLALRHITYQENWRLVRGLDYYMRTTFEVTATGLGSQDEESQPCWRDAGAMNPVAAPACDQCGALLTEEDFVAAEMVTIPAAQTRLRVPNGQEVITDPVGGLELKTPPWAGEMHEYPYVQWNMEVHQARLRAANRTLPTKSARPLRAICRNTNASRASRNRRAARSPKAAISISISSHSNARGCARGLSSRSKINPCATSWCNFSPMARMWRFRVTPIANRVTKIWTITGE